MTRRYSRFGRFTWFAAFFVIALARPATAGGLSFVESEIDGTDAVAVSPDGMNVYAPTRLDELSVFTRNPTTGAITLLEVHEDGVAGVDGINRSAGVTVSPDGNCVYATSNFDDKVAAFNRSNVTGALSFVGIKEDGVGGVSGLEGPNVVVVSPDDLHVYVGAQLSGAGPDKSSVVVFARTPPGCALTYVETEIGDVDGLGTSNGPDGLAISADGANLYVTGRVLVSGKQHGTVNVLTRNALTGALTFFERRIDGFDDVDALDSRVRAVAVSSDGTSVYAVSSGDDSIVVFSRDTGTGHLTFVEAQRDGGLNDGLASPRAVVVSPDDAYVYVGAFDDESVVVFRRSSATGALRFLEIHKNPDVDPPNNVLSNVEALAVSPAGDSLYVGGGNLTVFAVDLCGNGTLGPDEQCDDGNVVGGDGCSATCRLELCGAAPSGGCRGTAPLGASLTIRNRSPDKNDQLQWKWSKGDATMLAEYGDPTTSATYVLCVYDGSADPQPLLTAAAPADGTCKKGAPCWKAAGTAYKYNDGLLTPDGLQIIQLKEGVANGKARMQFKGKGINLAPPTLPLTLPVTVQVKNTATSVCWEAVYTTAGTNDPGQFKAKGD